MWVKFELNLLKCGHFSIFQFTSTDASVLNMQNNKLKKIQDDEKSNPWK